jgi:hypothetical protein
VAHQAAISGLVQDKLLNPKDESMFNPLNLSPKKSEFGWPDYWRMFRSKGLSLPLNYFFQAHAFDLIHGIDTHSWMVKAPYRNDERNADPDMQYRCSWTREIRLAYDVLRKNLGSEFDKFSFVDIGCGKGKVVLVWALALRRHGLRQRLVGLDYCEPFIEAAQDNQRVLGLFDDIAFIHKDAAEFDYASIGTRIIAYLYNPFDGARLRKVLARLDGTPSIIVYNNPVYVDELYAAGYKTVWRRHGGHPNAQTQILCKLDQPAVFNKNAPSCRVERRYA